MLTDDDRKRPAGCYWIDHHPPAGPPRRHVAEWEPVDPYGPDPDDYNGGYWRLPGSEFHIDPRGGDTYAVLGRVPGWEEYRDALLDIERFIDAEGDVHVASSCVPRDGGYDLSTMDGNARLQWARILGAMEQVRRLLPPDGRPAGMAGGGLRALWVRVQRVAASLRATARNAREAGHPNEAGYLDNRAAALEAALTGAPAPAEADAVAAAWDEAARWGMRLAANMARGTDYPWASATAEQAEACDLMADRIAQAVEAAAAAPLPAAPDGCGCGCPDCADPAVASPPAGVQGDGA
jgi:hypothetical protein